MRRLARITAVIVAGAASGFVITFVVVVFSFYTGRSGYTGARAGMFEPTFASWMAGYFGVPLGIALGLTGSALVDIHSPLRRVAVIGFVSALLGALLGATSDLLTAAVLGSVAFLMAVAYAGQVRKDDSAS